MKIYTTQYNIFCSTNKYCVCIQTSYKDNLDEKHTLMLRDQKERQYKQWKEAEL